MDDKIKAWIREGERLMSEFTAVLVDGFSDCAALVKADAAMRAHLRTTPEGFRLVPVEPTEAMLQAEIDAVSDYWFDHEELGNRTEATKIGYKAMLAASQESAALKEQSKC